jgi:hypothetical protein
VGKANTSDYTRRTIEELQDTCQSELLRLGHQLFDSRLLLVDGGLKEIINILLLEQFDDSKIA